MVKGETFLSESNRARKWPLTRQYHAHSDNSLFLTFGELIELCTYGFENFEHIICCCRFSKISRFLERILMEHIESICSMDCKLFSVFICSIRIRYRKRDIFEKLLQLFFNLYLNDFELSIVVEVLSLLLIYF